MRILQIAALLFLQILLLLVADEPREIVLNSDGNRSAEAKQSQTSWPSIRGPHWNGHSAETQLADSWPKDGPPVLWTRELSQGYSAFVTWNDRIATQYQTLRGQFVICLDANTGSTIWEHRYDWPYDPAGVYPGPRATPTYADGCLYFASPAGLIGCLNAESGDVIWSLELAKTFGGELTGFGYACSPTLVDGLVILPVGCPNAGMVALDAKTGDVRWQAGNYASSYAPAYPISFQGRDLVLGYGENSLVCHDRETGQILWQHKLSEGYDEHSSWPLYREPYLWISSPFKAGAELLELSAQPVPAVRSVMKQRLISNDIFPSVLLGDSVYGFDVLEPQAKTHRSTRGIFRCIDLMTGDERWSIGDGRPIRNYDAKTKSATIEESKPMIGHATVIVADNKLILFNDLGELILARATPERYDELGRVSVLAGEICWTQPSLSQGRLLVRNHSRAACLYLGRPESLDAELQRSATTAASIPQSEYFDWAAIILGVEPEYAFDLPSPEWLKKWYQVCLVGVIGGCFAFILMTMVIPSVRRLSPETRETTGWFLVFLVGALGTTFLSPRMNDFIFTWPVCLFAAFQPLMDRIVVRRGELNHLNQSHSAQTRRARWRSRLACLIFLCVCLLYFLACRRLSLVFEWVFLGGFAAAIPFSLAGKILFRKRRWHWLWKALCVVASFTAFFWSSVAFLHMRVR
jgi:hypothetical protein